MEREAQKKTKWEMPSVTMVGSKMVTPDDIWLHLLTAIHTWYQVRADSENGWLMGHITSQLRKV